jgi:glutathione S-transferase
MSTSGSAATIIGGPVSPYVRKVLAVCEMKGVPYRLDPIIPFFGDDRFSELSPLRRIPVYTDEAVSVSDSTVICEYLDERYREPPLLQADPAQRAKSRWIEEYADTRLGEVFIWRLFYPAAVAPLVFQKPRDTDRLARVAGEDVPEVMAYLEKIAPADGFLFGAAPSIADIAVAAPFRNLAYARVQLDATRWPRTLGWVARTTAIPAVAKVAAFADKLMKTPPDQHRAALAELGVALTERSIAGAAPRRGPMTTL